VKESNTAASKEMAAKLAQMRAERDRQDTMWTENISETDRCPQKGLQESPLQEAKKR
jgi:hypothetical protein